MARPSTSARPLGSRSAAVPAGAAAPSWSSCTDSRASSISGYQARGLCGELLAQRPHGEVRGPLPLAVGGSAGERVLLGAGLGGAATDDLRQRHERPLVVRVVAEHGAQRVLVERVTAARGLRRSARADPRGRGRPSHELTQTGQKCHDETLSAGDGPHPSRRYLTLRHARRPLVDGCVCRLPTTPDPMLGACPAPRTGRAPRAPRPDREAALATRTRPAPSVVARAPARARARGRAAEPETQRRVRDSAGLLSAAAMRRLDDDLEWYRALPAEDRSWVGLVAQAGITAFVTWFADPPGPPHGVGDIFAAAPPELTRSISLQHTLQLVRVVVDVVETHSDRLAAPGDEREVREAVLRYSREVAFSAAEVYARAAEVRGAWDARLEALVVDALVRGDVDDALRSRIAALGWSGRRPSLVMVGTTTSALDDVRAATSCVGPTRRAADDALVGIQGDRLVVFLGGEGDPLAAASTPAPRAFGPGPVVDRPGRRRPHRLRPVRARRAVRAGRRSGVGAGAPARSRPTSSCPSACSSGTSPRAARSSRRRTRRSRPARGRCWRPCRPTSAPGARSRRPPARSTCTPTRCATACAGWPT